MKYRLAILLVQQLIMWMRLWGVGLRSRIQTQHQHVVVEVPLNQKTMKDMTAVGVAVTVINPYKLNQKRVPKKLAPFLIIDNAYWPLNTDMMIPNKPTTNNPITIKPMGIILDWIGDSS